MDKPVKNLGIIGGTFDPVHLGHIGCAKAAANAFELDEVWFMPANHPNFKLDQAVTDISHRLKMLELALADQNDDRFSVSTVEAKREGATYTSDTLEILSEKFPDTNFYFITGTDSMFTLPRWHNSDRILQLATIIAVTRKGYFNPTSEQAEFIDAHSDKIKVIEADVIGASSSQIRELISKGKQVDEYLAQPVIDYILQNQLY